MSVVARQSFKYSIVGYLGFLLGTISAIAIFPADMEFYGKLRYVFSAAEIVMPFVVFGLSYATQKYYFIAEKSNKHQNLISLTLLGVFLNYLLFIALYYGINFIFPDIRNWNFFKDFWDYQYIIIPLIIILSLSQVYNKYISNYKRIVIPNVFENIFPKVANLGAFILFFYLDFSENTALYLFLGVCFLGLVGYMYYLNTLEKTKPDFSLDFVKKDKLWREILNYGFFGFLGNIGNYLSFRIAGYMIPGYLSFEDNGVYATIIAITSLLTVPQMGLSNIATPIINQQLENNETKELNLFHQKTSLSLLFLGLTLFACVLVGYPYLTHLMQNGRLLRMAEPVLWITGIGLMFDLATGFNGQIISMSRYYRINIVMTLFLALVNIGLNYYFLVFTHLGLIGVALASTTALILYNILKISFNIWKFKVHPFSIEMLFALLLCIIATTIVILIPEFESNLLNLFFKPFVVLLIIFIGNLFLKIIPLDKYLKKDFFKSILKFK